MKVYATIEHTKRDLETLLSVWEKEREIRTKVYEESERARKTYSRYLNRLANKYQIGSTKNLDPHLTAHEREHLAQRDRDLGNARHHQKLQREVVKDAKQAYLKMVDVYLGMLPPETIKTRNELVQGAARCAVEALQVFQKT